MSKVSIIGSGNVGSGIAYNIAQNEVADEIALIDIRPEKAMAEALDISHSICQRGVVVRCGEYKDVSDSDVVVVTSGAPRRAGESRNDLLDSNTAIMRSVISSILPHYNGCVVVIVSNPVDVMTSSASELLHAPKGKVIGTGTLLDTVRFQYELAKVFKVPTKKVECLVVGEHGDGSIPVWSSVKIDGQEVENFKNVDKLAVAENVRISADKIIANKGYTMFGIAFETYDLVRSILLNSSAILPVSIDINGSFGINDVFLSLPSKITSGGAGDIFLPKLSDEELAAFKRVAEKSREMQAYAKLQSRTRT